MSVKSDSEEEEEVTLYADFTEATEESLFEEDNLMELNLLGLMEKEPIIQVNNSFFQGTYQRAMGTYLFFEGAPYVESEDPIFAPAPESPLQFYCKTRKILNMKRVFLEKKFENVEEKQLPASVDVKVEQFSTEQEAIDVIVKELKLQKQDNKTHTRSAHITAESTSSSSVKTEKPSTNISTAHPLQPMDLGTVDNNGIVIESANITR